MSQSCTRFSRPWTALLRMKLRRLGTQLVYERALVAFPVTSHLWLQYARFAETKLNISAIINSIYERATRNCPWVSAECLDSQQFRCLHVSMLLSSYPVVRLGALHSRVAMQGTIWIHAGGCHLGASAECFGARRCPRQRSRCCIC